MATLPNWSKTLYFVGEEPKRHNLISIGGLELGWAYQVWLQHSRETTPVFGMDIANPRNFTRGTRNTHLNITNMVIKHKSMPVFDLLRRGGVPMTIESENPHSPALIVEIEDVLLLSQYYNEDSNSFDLLLIIPDNQYKQYTKPATNKQAKILLKR